MDPTERELSGIQPQKFPTEIVARKGPVELSADIHENVKSCKKNSFKNYFRSPPALCTLSRMAKHHPDLIFCRKQAGVAIGELELITSIF